MRRTFLRSKIHRATITQADLNYEGSIALDCNLIEAANLQPFERVEIYNITNGQRLATYVIEAEAGSGTICLNGAAARLAQPGDLVIICCYCELEEREISGHSATIVMVDGANRVTSAEDRPVQPTKTSAR